MKKTLYLAFGVLVGLAIALVVLPSIIVAQPRGLDSNTSHSDGISGPVEQGDAGFYRAPYVPVGETGMSGPIEQGDTGFWRSPYVPVGKTGTSGPVEQGDAGFE